jgi:hypothetical protein
MPNNRTVDILVFLVLAITLVLTVRDALATAGFLSRSRIVYGWSQRAEQISYPNQESGK